MILHTNVGYGYKYFSSNGVKLMDTINGELYESATIKTLQPNRYIETDIKIIKNKEKKNRE